jgi:hypothetical protein
VFSCVISESAGVEAGLPWRPTFSCARGFSGLRGAGLGGGPPFRGTRFGLGFPKFPRSLARSQQSCYLYSMGRTIRIADLLANVDPRVESRIRDAKNDLRQSAGQALQAASRLTLKGARLGGQVRVDISPGYPAVLEDLELEYPNSQAEHLVRHRAAMEKYLDLSDELGQMIAHLPEGERSSATAREEWLQSLVSSKGVVENLLRFCVERSAVRRLLAVDKDIFGTYRVSAGEARIDIYWAVIGYVARSLGVDPVDLAVVVLVHELAHAFSHLGKDADGSDWAGFWKAEAGLAEGIAQYYTHLVLENAQLRGRADTAKHAYELLLPHQPEIYQRHTSWVRRWQPEAVRAALIEARNRRCHTRDEFEVMVKAQSDRIRAGWD